jgi:hypothetical protein
LLGRSKKITKKERWDDKINRMDKRGRKNQGVFRSRNIINESNSITDGENRKIKNEWNHQKQKGLFSKGNGENRIKMAAVREKRQVPAKTGGRRRGLFPEDHFGISSNSSEGHYPEDDGAPLVEEEDEDDRQDRVSPIDSASSGNPESGTTSAAAAVDDLLFEQFPENDLEEINDRDWRAMPAAEQEGRLPDEVGAGTGSTYLCMYIFKA